MTDPAPLDPATVQRCIDALAATGKYGYTFECISDFEPAVRVEQWTYTTHPMDVLRGLLKPEKSEAEKLVDEWIERNGETSEVLINGYTSEHVALAQFVLDRVSEQLAFPSTTGVEVSASEPQYVYGPWIKWQGGECPVPGDWMVEVRFAGMSGDVLSHCRQAQRHSWEHWHRIFSASDITGYRVRFEVGKWYDWTGGPCPVDGDVRVEVQFANGRTTNFYDAAAWADGAYDWWKHESPRPTNHITKFRICPQEEDA